MVAEDGAVVYCRAAGFADREVRFPATTDTIIRHASLSKTIVSAAAVLIEQGRLTLEPPVAMVLPYFRSALGDGRRPQITIRQLLTHIAGLSYGAFDPDPEDFRAAGVSDGVDGAAITLAETCVDSPQFVCEMLPVRAGATRWQSMCWARSSRRLPDARFHRQSAVWSRGRSGWSIRLSPPLIRRA